MSKYYPLGCYYCAVCLGGGDNQVVFNPGGIKASTKDRQSICKKLGPVQPINQLLHWSETDPLSEYRDLTAADITLDSILELFRGIPSDTTLAKAVELRTEDGEGKGATARVLRQLVEDPSAALQRFARGESAVLRLDRLARCLDSPDPTAPLSPLRGLPAKVGQAFGLPTVQAAVWIGSAKSGSKASAMHAAPHDRIVLQLHGSKAWKLCYPRRFPELALPVRITEGRKALSPTAKAGMRDIKLREHLGDGSGAGGRSSGKGSRGAANDSGDDGGSGGTADEREREKDRVSNTGGRSAGKSKGWLLPGATEPPPPYEDAYTDWTVPEDVLMCDEITLHAGDRLSGARFSAEIYVRGCHWIPCMFA
jgi:hypothetical protein